MKGKAEGFGAINEKKLLEKKFNRGEPVFWRLPNGTQPLVSSPLEEQEARIKAIIGIDENDEEELASVNEETMAIYGQYLIANLVHPCYLTGSEDFSWEERFVFGYMSQKEHSEIRKKRASYLDTFRLIELIGDLNRWGELGAKVKRMEDGKMFELSLSELEVTDCSSPNYQLLNDYSFWFWNYR
ncbi:MAG: hypothetical protein ACKO5Q_29095 [Microcystaceae cyanobacterium]